MILYLGLGLVAVIMVLLLITLPMVQDGFNYGTLLFLQVMLTILHWLIWMGMVLRAMLQLDEMVVL